MRRRLHAQSMVEMALLLPFMFFIFFAIIDLGWYIYGYATVYNAARRGAEEASQLPPYVDKLAVLEDECAGAIYRAVNENAFFFTLSLVDNDTWNAGAGDAMAIAYPGAVRELGAQIEVKLRAHISPLTPLLNLGRTFGLGGVGPDGTPYITIETTSRRSVESLGVNPAFTSGIACQPTGGGGGGGNGNGNGNGN